MKDDNKVEKEQVKDLVLIEQEKIDAVAVFTGEQGVERILEEIEAKVRAFVPDLSTVKGRKEVASVSYKVSQSKTILDDLGKALVADWKTKAAKVDATRKIARDRLDTLKIEVRQPLTDWEAAEEIRLAEEKKRKEMEDAEDIAWAMHDMYLRELDMKVREAALAKAEAERQAAIDKEAAERKAAAEKAEAERHAREEAERQKELEARLEKDRQAAEARRIQEAKEEAARAAEAAAKAAEEARIRAEVEHAAALKRAEEEKLQAVIDAENKAKAEAERKEQARLAGEEAKKQEDLKRKRDIEHRKNVNCEALEDLMGFGLTAEVGKELISAIVKGQIVHISINY